MIVDCAHYRDGQRQRAEATQLLEEGTMAVLCEKDIEEVERIVFAGVVAPTERVYFLRREVTDFYRAVHPLLGPLDGLERGAYRGVGHDLSQYFRDVDDHLKLVNDEVAAQRWAAIIAVPTFIASLYGMNFQHMPELGWSFGYPAVVGLMLATGVAIYAFLKRAHWL